MHKQLLNTCSLHPRFPLIHSPIFSLLQQQGKFGHYAAAAQQLHSQGYLILDLGRDRISQIAQAIKTDLSNQFDLTAWRESGGKRDLRLQDAWKQCEAVRQLSLLPDIHKLLRLFWGRQPFAFQTLNFPVGSQQHYHSDAVHFHSEPAGFMCGVWVALEDIHTEAGPLEYFPGSHHLPYLQRNDVDYDEEYDSNLDQSIFYEIWDAEIKSHSFSPKHFTPRLGQALIWTANLLHGGSPVLDLGLTRWSQVTHYFFEGCRWYTPLLSDWPCGAITWRQPVNVATGVIINQKKSSWNLRRNHESSLALSPAQLKDALLDDNLTAANTIIVENLQSLGNFLPQAWIAWSSYFKQPDLAWRLLPLLENTHKSNEHHSSPTLSRWIKDLQPLICSSSIDHLIYLGSGRYLAYGWSACTHKLEIISYSSNGQWQVHAVKAPRLSRPDVAIKLQLPDMSSLGFVVDIKLPDEEILSDLWIGGKAAGKSLVDYRGISYLRLVDHLLTLCQLDHTPVKSLPQLLDYALGSSFLSYRKSLQHVDAWTDKIDEFSTYGHASNKETITIVVPLYRRWDFVLGQLASFMCDPLFTTGQAEVLYVVDDPDIIVEFISWCTNQAHNYPFAISVATLSFNMGFAMASNIGILLASTPYVVLLNSDVLPINPGWCEPLIKVLATQPNALVAPVLLYENHQIQHVGMRTRPSPIHTSLPTCSHPYKGLAFDQWSELHPTQVPHQVELLSGAALVCEQKKFIQSGGFDPVFGRCDFEDLEFSLRWQRLMGPCLIVPQSRMTHLERQSISCEPDQLASWRQVCNAWFARELCPELQSSLK